MQIIRPCHLEEVANSLEVWIFQRITQYEKSNDIPIDDNNQIATASPYYSISSPERTDFYSYYYNSTTAAVTAGSVTTTTKDENPLFSPLSFSNSSVSSFTDSINMNTTPPPSPMSPIISSSNTTASTVLKSVDEFADILIERCTWLLDLSDIAFSHVREMETIIDQTQFLINASSTQQDTELNTLLNQCKITIENMYNSPVQLKDQETSIKAVIKDIRTICQRCVKLSSKLPSLSNCTTDHFRKEIPKVMTSSITADDYKSMKSDQIDENATWFRHNFVGKPYQTFIGSLQPIVSRLPLIDVDKKKQPVPKRRNSKSLLTSFLSSSTSHQPQSEVSHQSSIGIISVIQERAKDFSGPGNGAAAILGSQYRIIIRSKQPEQARFIIHECMAKETQSQLESRGESHKLNKMVSNDYKRLRPFSSNNSNNSSNNSRLMNSAITTISSENQNTFTSRMIRAAILSACPNIDLRSFKELSAESTIMAGLEKELLKYDEIHIPKHYKFGLLTIKNNQTTEEAWFSNTGLSSNLSHFLSLMGKRIDLNGYQGYAAGLDTKTGESGEFAYISKWNDFDIMFHVAPLMPSQANDKQQVLRKKHIGNDIVCIVFLEGDQLFNPKAIRSQFLHVYVIIRPEVDCHNNRQWRVEVLSNKNVGEFGPSLPSPPVFKDDETLREFLTLKLINAENAALKSDKFSVPNNKARLGLLSSHIETAFMFNTPQVMRSASTNRLLSSSSKFNKSAPLKKHGGKDEEEEQDGLVKRRPKSVNNNKSTHHLQNHGGGSRLLREAILDEEKRRVVIMASTDIPPMPSVSRSTILQDFKKGFSRKKTTSSSSSLSPSSQEQKKVLRKSSQLKISSIPEDTVANNTKKLNGKSKKKRLLNLHLILRCIVCLLFSLDEEMFVGKDINISSESFISKEQLFSITSEKRPPQSPQSPVKTITPKFIITTSATTTTTTTTSTTATNTSNPSLSWR
ncbi:hypothetical protein INT47_002850 [Mucor saturninus]|uniref:Rap-GAP domain-containing protein n=1 Tax=Mucor saturninus TaxID=64648 RepID=A0A8H7UR28_9FUNG|nr:hypothetical protein INT47_002850 [Mucor saturninus]